MTQSHHNYFIRLAIGLVCVMIAVAVAIWLFYVYLPNHNAKQLIGFAYDEQATAEYIGLMQSSTQISRTQNETGEVLIPPLDLRSQIAFTQSAINLKSNQLAIYDMTIAQAKLKPISTELEKKAAELKAKAIATPSKAVAAGSSTVPILLYHKPPTNFAAQLDSLQAKGYTTISMTQLADFLDYGTALPIKPIVITFDDGFSDQLSTIPILQSHHMKATYYIIWGGEKSNWCIGILRHNTNCGDNYLDTTQLHQLANSGVAEIAAHTIDHLNLAQLSLKDQQYQIVTSKEALQKELNISITSFAYPYGRYNANSVSVVRQAGFRTAVTTVEGTSLSKATRLVLPRVRNALLLP